MIALLTGGSSVALGTGSAGTLRGCPTGERHVKAAGTLFLVAKSLWEPGRPTLRPWAACRFREPGLPGPSTHALDFSPRSASSAVAISRAGSEREHLRYNPAARMGRQHYRSGVARYVTTPAQQLQAFSLAASLPTSRGWCSIPGSAPASADCRIGVGGWR